VTDPDAGRSVSGGGCSVREARPREPKTATVERREASVPRHGTQGASQAPGVPRYGTLERVPRTHPNVSRRSAHPSIGVSEAKRQSPGAKSAPRERDGLFDIVRIANARAVAPVWSSPRKRGHACSTNLRLQDSVAGSASLFPACSLQGTVQPQRVAETAAFWPNEANATRAVGFPGAGL
jgi:hypothetical protein